MDDWNDARLVLAVSRTGSLTAAAKGLRVDHSTVFRRLAALEARLGLPLFERGPGGAYQPTTAGVRAALAAERMEDEALGHGARPRGPGPALDGAVARDLLGDAGLPAAHPPHRAGSEPRNPASSSNWWWTAGC